MQPLEAINNAFNLDLQTPYLRFENEEVFKETMESILDQPEEKMRAWEQSLGHTSLYTKFEKALDIGSITNMEALEQRFSDIHFETVLNSEWVLGIGDNVYIYETNVTSISARGPQVPQISHLDYKLTEINTTTMLVTNTFNNTIITIEGHLDQAMMHEHIGDCDASTRHFEFETIENEDLESRVLGTKYNENYGLNTQLGMSTQYQVRNSNGNFRGTKALRIGVALRLLGEPFYSQDSEDLGQIEYGVNRAGMECSDIKVEEMKIAANDAAVRKIIYSGVGLLNAPDPCVCFWDITWHAANWVPHAAQRVGNTAVTEHELYIGTWNGI